MQSYRKSFGASRLVAGAFFVLCGGLAVSLFVPGVTDYIAHANLVGRLRMFNSWEPEHRLLLAYAFGGLMAFAAVFYLRLLIDNTMVVLDREGIEVRHPLGVHRALWRDFDSIATKGLFGIRDVRVLFRPGRDATGRKLSSKVRLPSPILGVNTKAVLFEVVLLSSVGQALAPSTGGSKPGPGAPPAIGAARPVFGRRQ